jgi:mgtE-like transporter
MLTVRGNVGGILSGKLSTMLHIGEAEPRFRGNTGEFYSFIKAIFTLTFVSTLIIGIIAFLANITFGNASWGDFLFFIIVPPVTSIATMGIAVPITAAVGFRVFRRGLDPDVLLYPMMSTFDDILVAIVYVIVVSAVLVPGITVVMLLILLILGGLFTLVFARQRHIRIFTRALKEGGPIVLLSNLLGTFGGVGLASFRDGLARRPAILILYPALIDTLGDIGSILGSMEATKLALGHIASFTDSLKDSLRNFISVELAGAFWHILFGVVAFLIGISAGLNPNLGLLVAVALTTNMISFLFISTFSIAIATQTFKRGLDPDNFVIPLVTSVSDITATLVLISVLILSGA